MAAYSTNKYLDLTGLGSFWTKVKGYIATEINGLNKKVNNNDAAIRSYIESLKVNGQAVVKTPAEGLGTALNVTIDSSHINLTETSKEALKAGNLVAVTGKGAAYEAAETVEGGLIQLDKRMDAVETVFETGVVNTFEVAVTHDTPQGEGDTVEWVKASKNSATGAVTLTIDDTAIDNKFESLDNDIINLQANSGVVGIKVVDENKNAENKSNYVAVTVDKVALNANSQLTVEKDGVTYDKGLLTLTIDETALDTKVRALDLADTTEKDHRIADVELLAGPAFTAGDGETAGAWAADGAPKYKSITELSARMATIDTNVVTKVAEGTSVETYVDLTVADTKAEGSNDTVVTVTINDTKLANKVTELATADTNEATARKAADALLAGAGWDSAKGEWTTAPTYATIAKLNEQMLTAEAKIGALSAATAFAGVVAWDPTKVTIGAKVTENGVESYPITGTDVPEGTKMQNGDIVIKGQKEYILDASQSAFVELGDTTEENARLGEIEEWIDNNAISETEIAALDWTHPTLA